MSRNKRPIQVVMLQMAIGDTPVTAWEKARVKRHETRKATPNTPIQVVSKPKPASAPTVADLAAKYNVRV